jgi:hypothetical protein
VVSSFGSAHDAWIITYLDLTRDAKRSDGTDTPFAPGHPADDIFFLAEPEVGREPELLVDEVVLYDAGTPAG